MLADKFWQAKYRTILTWEFLLIVATMFFQALYCRCKSLPHKIVRRVSQIATVDWQIFLIDLFYDFYFFFISYIFYQFPVRKIGRLFTDHIFFWSGSIALALFISTCSLTVLMNNSLTRALMFSSKGFRTSANSLIADFGDPCLVNGSFRSAIFFDATFKMLNKNYRIGA